MRRLLSSKAFKKISDPTPPAKKTRTAVGASSSSAAATPAASSSSSSSAAAAAAPAQEVETSDDEEDGDDDDSERDSDGAGLGDGAKGDGKVSNKDSLSALFADCSTEVCLGVGVSLFACLAFVRCFDSCVCRSVRVAHDSYIWWWHVYGFESFSFVVEYFDALANIALFAEDSHGQGGVVGQVKG